MKNNRILDSTTLFGIIILALISVTTATSISSPEFDLEEDIRERILSPTNTSLGNKTSKILSGSRPVNNGQHSERPLYGNGQYQVDQSSQGSGPVQSVQNHPSISSVDMQLLNAMEKLVGRMDKLDARVKTLESIVYFLTNKEKPEQGSCPEHFSKIDGVKGKCYYVSSLGKSSAGVFDWKTAAGECGKMGGRLAEMLSYSDFYRISNFLTRYTDTRSNVATDFWTGGLNPGLIWIWSESGQQIDLDKRFWNENDNSSNTPGCLKLSFSIRLNTFFYKGGPCSQTQNFLCEVLDNAVARALANFETELASESEENV